MYEFICIIYYHLKDSTIQNEMLILIELNICFISFLLSNKLWKRSSNHTCNKTSRKGKLNIIYEH